MLTFIETKRIKSGFTLIELLVVIAIIGILATILIPVLSSARLSSNSAKSVSNLRQIGAAALMHANENGGRFPSAYWKAEDGWLKALYLRIYGVPFDEWGEGQGVVDTVFWSPVAEDLPPERRFCYGMNNYFQTFSGYKWSKNGDDIPLDGPLSAILREPARTCFIADTKGRMVLANSDLPFYNAGNTSNVLFFDGHVQALTREEIPETWQSDEGKIFWMGGPTPRPSSLTPTE